ncbi:MAG: DUF2817 domain-containing protein [Planctomycetes bacterium]|nr:DUF2817 domain-containing protein [Planctomycetota bacterium]
MGSFRSVTRTTVIIAVILISINSVGLAQKILSPGAQSDFANYTTHDEMMQYLQDLQAASTDMLLSTFGTTIEGRQQPYAIFSRPMVTSSAEAMMSGKPIVVLAANIHGGEKTVRESLLVLAGELADEDSDTNRLLDYVVIVMVPSINPDGFERSTRGNATGVDMNREFINLEQPAVRNYVVNILHEFQPHLFLDGHNGGSYPYNITYQGPCSAAADQTLTDICDQEIFPFIDTEVQAAGFKSWYYSGGNRESWRGIPMFARGSINWGGLVNSIGVLFESPGQDRKDGALSSLAASRALVKYIAGNPQKVIDVVRNARNKTVYLGQKAQGDLAVQMTTGPKDYKVSYDIAEGRGEERQIIRVTGAELRIQPVPTKTRPRPYAYILEPRAYKAAALLKLQNIMVEVLQEETEIDVEAYVATGIRRSNLNDHPAAVTTLTLEDETVKSTQAFPKGSYIIRTGQPLGRLAAYLLEPETDDNVITWNRMDAILPRIPTIETPARGGERGGAQQAAGQRRIAEGRQQQAQQQRAGRGQRAGQGGARQAIIPIFKLMIPTKLPTKISK